MGFIICLTFMEGITMARPSFKIDPARLRSLREESNQTQLEVANRAHFLLKKPSTASEKTILNVYQRIEHTGKTSKRMADAIAQVFDVSVEILQGVGTPKDSADIIKQVRQQLQEQRDSVKNLTLLDALKKHVAEYAPPLDEDTMFYEFASDIAIQIEAAQIGHDSNEIARLEEITGWSKAQLQGLGGVEGHWLFLNKSRVAHETVVTQGISSVINTIYQSFINRHDVLSNGDSSITLTRSLPWIHVEIGHPIYSNLNCKFSFVRCKPYVNGFKWVNPTWRDEYWLENLKNWAFQHISFFTDFDGNHYPRDLFNLRFAIQEINRKRGTRRIAYSKGSLDELPEDVFKRFKAEASSHYIVIEWLASGLAYSLAPHLTKFPTECWRIEIGAGQILIHLDIPYKLMHKYTEKSYDISYLIKLVEEVSAGTYLPTPWPNSSVELVFSKLKDRLFREYDNPFSALQFNDFSNHDTDIDNSTEAK